MICLVGPGDSAKTTILDALALVATPRSGVSFVDADFYNSDCSTGFLIEATFSELPPELLDERKFGLELRGLTETGEIAAEVGEHEPALTVRLTVDESLDPQWLVISAHNPEGRPIGPRDRAWLGVSRIAEGIDRQFSWARGSTLAKSTASPDDISLILAAAYRQAQDAVRGTDLSSLDSSLTRVRLAADQVGVGDLGGNLDVRLDLSPSSGSALALHSGEVPVLRAGLGTRRLLATGIELLATSSGAVVALDEIEHGLEPHRLRQLLSTLRTKVETPPGHGQVVFTTHSPVVLELLGTDGLHVVRNESGDVSVRPVASDLIELVRSNPSALLARRVLVCEGRTEAGLVLGAAEGWPERHEARPFTYLGTTVADGRGRTVAPVRATELKRLGYEVAVFGDSDAPLEPGPDILLAQGIAVFQWPGEMATERRVLTDCRWETVWAVATYIATEVSDEESMVNIMLSMPDGIALMERLGRGRADFGSTLLDLATSGIDEISFRDLLARAAQKKGWLKSIEHGRQLGLLLLQDEEIPTTETGELLRKLEVWSYGGD